MEAGEKIEGALWKIEGEVAKGNYDLKGMGVWGLVGEVRRDLRLAERFAERIAQVDRLAFEKTVNFGLTAPVWLGNLLELAGTAVGLGAILFALGEEGNIQGIGLVAGAGILMGTLHPLAHYVVGRALGITFTNYFLNAPLKVQPCVKTDYATYLRVAPLRRAAMHAAGALATKLVPILALAMAVVLGAPGWSILALAVFSIVPIVTDVFFSTKIGDWKRVLREVRAHRRATKLEKSI
jgi:hypothetical protein